MIYLKFFVQDNMRRVLYLGTHVPSFQEGIDFVHCPIIEIKGRDLESLRLAFLQFPKSTYLIFTSRHAVVLTMEAVLYFFGDYAMLKNKIAIAIGPATKEALSLYDIRCLQTQVSTQEGVISLLDQIDLTDAYLFYPRSSRARPHLAMYLEKNKYQHYICDLYDTCFSTVVNIPPLEEFHEIMFTSPSTVEAFFSQIRSIPQHIKLTAIGPITQQAIKAQLSIQW
jgi:uroporphyrinogen-III synthase